MMSDDPDGDGARASSLPDGPGGGTSHDGPDNSLGRLAQSACDAAEKGEVSALHSLLNISVEESAKKSNDAVEGGGATTTNRCRELLGAFLSLIGCGDEVDIPVSVKPHLLLRALLRIPHHEYSTPWDAATAAVESLQYTQCNLGTNRTDGGKFGHGEELAMVTEIRSFVTSLRTQTRETLSARTTNQLLELGNAIVDPLRMNPKCTESQSGDQATTKVRRPNSYLLPLQLIPVLLAAMDAVEDMHGGPSAPGNAKTMVEDDAANRDGSRDGRNEAEGRHIHASDRLLSSMFASLVHDGNDCNVPKLQRIMRADASLPLLSLVMDDIGLARMKTTVPMHGTVTYLDCLSFGLNDVIGANLVCHAIDDGSMGGDASDTKQRILDEAATDEGVHIIPLSDYPALMRCIFRMVAQGLSSNASWGYLLIRLYHATAVATSTSPFPTLRQQKSAGEGDRLATLSTVESHVLLPSCTGASVSTVKSVLGACIVSCCPSCIQTAEMVELVRSSGDCVVPIWAVAGLALLIMRARATSLSHSASSAGFGPRAVFRIASDIMCKRRPDQPTPSGGNDEVGYALSVLLHLSGFKDGVCRACCDGSFDDDAEQSACCVLKHGYYVKGQFFHRYVKPQDYSYTQQLGFRSLNAYADLVRASLNHSALHTAGKTRSNDAFVAETARTWIDAANMFLDESNRSPANGKESVSFRDGTAMAIVIIVVVFFEVPSSQNDIVRTIYDRVANMASHNAHNNGRQSEKSCFVLISGLAWSLAAMNENHSSIDVVRGKGRIDKSDHLASVLGPLCTMLSKSALPQQHLNGLSGYGSSLPFGALRQLAHALSPTPSGREVILAMAQKNMSVLATSSPYARPSKSAPFFESIPSTPSAANDAVYLAMDSLCVLVKRVQTSSQFPVDDCCRDAVRVLTDVIILQRLTFSSSAFSDAASYVPKEALSWMLDQLNKSARSGKLTQWTSQRLFRACLVAMLQSVAFEPTESDLYCPYFLPQARSDWPRLLRLSLSLHDQLAKTSDKVHLSLTCHLLRSFKSQPDVAREDSINQLHKDCRDALGKGFNPLDTSVDCVIDGILLVTFAESAAKMTQTKQFDRPERVDADLWNQLNEYLCDAERHHFQQARNDQKESSAPLPSWIQLKDNFRPDDLLMNCTDSTFLRLPLCDIVADLLLQEWSHRNETPAETHARDLSLLLGVNSVLGSKRKAAEEFAGRLPKQISMSHDSICGLYELSSQHLRSILGNSENKKLALADVDLMVQNLMATFMVIRSTNTLQGEGVSSQRLMASFWALYCSLADDESSQLFCSFVKECYIDMGKYFSDLEANYDISETSYSLLMITSADDMDFHVRHLRGVLLLTLSKVISFIPLSQNALSLDERKASLDTLLQVLGQLCQDLDAGFHGYSAGLTKKLMLLFLDAMSKCIDAVAAVFGSFPASVQHQLRSSFVTVQQSATIIWDIFREDSLRQASVVKGALRLCIDKMPSLVRRVERVINECIVEKPLCEHLCTVIDECTDSLRSEQKANKSTTRSSDGSNVVEAGVADDTTTGNLDSTVNGDEDKVLIAPNDNTNVESNLPATEEAGEGHAKETIFPNNETLPWAYNCALVAVANLFGDTCRIIASSGNVGRRRVKCTRGDSPALACRRIEDYARVHTSLCRLFDEKIVPKAEANDAKADSEESALVLAESLSYRGKAAMCSCVEKMAMTLNISAKRIVRYCEESTAPSPSKTKSHAVTKLGESMVCLLGWLHSVKANEAKHDLVTGILQWYINEKRHFDLSVFGKSDGYPILGRLPKIIFRLEGFEAEMRKLDIVLEDLSGREDAISKDTVLLLDQMTKGEESFRDLVVKCIDAVDSRKTAMKSSEVDGDLMSDDAASDADLEGDEFTSTGKRRKQRYAPLRKSRKMALRSRNEWIDTWLAVDDEEFGSAPGERYNVDDAFVDLEDFLVEG